MFTTQATSTNSRGGLAVSQPSEDGGEQVIGHDEEDAAADAHIAGREVHGLGRSLHQHRDRPGEAHQAYEKNGGEKRENKGGAADDGANLLRPLLAQIPGNENGDAQGQLGHHKGDQVQHLAASGNGGKAGGGAEAAYHQQAHGAVGRLKNQRTQNGEHEPAQLFQDAALGKIAAVIHSDAPSFRT